MTESLGNKTIKGVFWSSVDRFSMQGVHFIDSCSNTISKGFWLDRNARSIYCYITVFDR